MCPKPQKIWGQSSRDWSQLGSRVPAAPRSQRILSSLSLCIWNTNCSFPGEIKALAEHTHCATATAQRSPGSVEPSQLPPNPFWSAFRDRLELNKDLLQLPQSLGLPLARAHLFQPHQGHHPKAFCGQGRSLTFLIFRYSCKIWSWMV